MPAKINLQYHDDKDHYSDGDIEEELLSIVKTRSDYDEILQKDNRWPILYHLSPIRQNILNWYPFDPNGNCLEIGAGCGAITGMLCQKLAKVTAVELSKRRATINFERNKAYDNLEIIVGNLNNIVFDEKFDYITLIGVLEYAGSFTKTQNPYLDFLKKIRALLKPEGRLFIAIENRYGLKYFSGAKEDHTGRYFDGIEGYEGIDWVKTFGKEELINLLEEAGFCDNIFYYPHPDYKMPIEIYSDDMLPDEQTFLQSAPNFDFERFLLFDESKAFTGIAANRQFDFFANSFLIDCGV